MKKVVIDNKLVSVKNQEFLKLNEHRKKIEGCSSLDDEYTDLIDGYVIYCNLLTKKYNKLLKYINGVFTF